MDCLQLQLCGEMWVVSQMRGVDKHSHLLLPRCAFDGVLGNTTAGKSKLSSESCTNGREGLWRGRGRG